MFSEKGCSFRFEWLKWNFTTFDSRKNPLATPGKIQHSLPGNYPSDVRGQGFRLPQRTHWACW